MDWSCRNGYLMIVASGLWTISDMKGIMRRAAQRAPAAGFRGLLIDQRGCQTALEYPQIDALARFRGAMKEKFGNDIALIVSDAFHYGLARISAALHESQGFRVGIFFDEHSAWDWITDAAPHLPPSDKPAHQNGPSVHLATCG